MLLKITISSYFKLFYYIPINYHWMETITLIKMIKLEASVTGRKIDFHPNVKLMIV